MTTRRLGALCWVAAAPLFLVTQLVTGFRWTEPSFSWATNNISDLGNVTCGIWDTTRPRYVCSPWHDLMNAGFVVTAVLLLAGMALNWRSLGESRVVRGGCWLVLLSIAGFGMIGVFPADRNENLHLLAALLIFVVGNVGIALAGFARFRAVSLAFGAAGLAGTVLFALQADLLLGTGGWERVAVFCLPVWAAYLGARIMAGHPAPEAHRAGVR